MQTLTRDQAVKRILDIQKGVQNSHISSDCLAKGYILNDCERGAVNELMAIFDIKEGELLKC